MSIVGVREVGHPTNAGVLADVYDLCTASHIHLEEHEEARAGRAARAVRLGRALALETIAVVVRCLWAARIKLVAFGSLHGRGLVSTNLMWDEAKHQAMPLTPG